ncbi:MAG: hypothetical protein GEU87_00635 [Alphaproteobacteria bacterium]|nr:hypothetical protein [Alphaproteobacteria bacterium]
MGLHDVVGMVGVALVMVMYILLQTGRTTAERPSFSIGNAVGSALILYSLAFDFNFAAALIEVFWLLISLYGLWRALRMKRSGL